MKAGKDASAKASMKRGGWDKEGATYRDLIHKKEEAISLEQQNRVVMSDEMIDQQLAELGPKYEENPQSVDTARKIAELYEQKEDLENAVQWYTYAASLSNNTDGALVRKSADLRIKQYDASIQQFEEYLAAADPSAPEAVQAREQLETIKRDRAGMELQEARVRASSANPTRTSMFRASKLGEILVNLGEYKDAIPELQKARQNPSVRLRAMSLLGKCFVERNMLDLAAKTLEDAAGELLGHGQREEGDRLRPRSRLRKNGRQREIHHGDEADLRRSRLRLQAGEGRGRARGRFLRGSRTKSSYVQA